MIRDQNERADKEARRDELLKEVSEIGRPDAYVLHEVIRLEGDEELRRHGLALFLSAFAAGLSIALSLIVPGVLKSHLPEADWVKVVTTMATRSASCRRPGTPAAVHREHDHADPAAPARPLDQDGVPRGAALADRPVRQHPGNARHRHGAGSCRRVRAAGAQGLREISHDAIAHGFWSTFVKGVFAGWMIALMVWFLPATGSAAPS